LLNCCYIQKLLLDYSKDQTSKDQTSKDMFCDKNVKTFEDYDIDK